MKKRRPSHRNSLKFSARRAGAEIKSTIELIASISDSTGLSREDVSAWLQSIAEWRNFCEEMIEFLTMLLRAGELEADRVEPQIQVFMLGIRVFSSRDVTSAPEQCRQRELCVNSVAEFAVIVDDSQELREMTQEFYCLAFGLWPAVAEALIENRLLGWRDWREADSPVAWVRDRARDIHERDYTQGGFVRNSDALYRTPISKRTATPESLAFDYRETARDVMSLEEISEFPGVADQALQRKCTWMSIDALKAAIQDDEDLRKYMELRLAGWKPRAAWEHLGWEAHRGLATDRRFRRLRDKVKASGFEHQSRELELAPGLSDASCTVVKERLRFPVHPSLEATLSGRVVYDPRIGGDRFGRND